MTFNPFETHPYDIANKILQAHRGTRFIKADLHIHTPASKDWDEKNLSPQNKSENITPEQIVQSALTQGLELIAITDHNSVEWCEKVIEEAQGTRLAVLPGFELSTSLNIHLLAIFDTEKPISELRNLLIELGIKEENFGYAKPTSKFGVGEKNDINPNKFKIIETIKGHGGIVIPAHVELDAGIIGRLGGIEDVKQFLRECSLVEITNSNKYHPVLMELLRNNHREFALIQNSDAHTLEDIGKRSSWLKLDSKSLTSVKQIGFEPQNKVQLTETDPSKKSHIIGVYSDGGYLGGQVHSFNEDLNCIIGGRGAGKSTLLDYLRFVLGNEPDDDILAEKYHKRLTGLIQNSTTVSVLLEDNKDELWLCQRQLLYETDQKKGKEQIEIISPKTSVWFVSLNREEAHNRGQIDLPFLVDFYSQGEVQSITQQAESTRQLRLVDNFNRNSITQRQNAIKQLQEKLSNLKTDVQDNIEERTSLEENASELPEKEDRIAEIEASLKSDKWKENQMWEDANNWVERTKQHFQEQQQTIENTEFIPIERREFQLPPENSDAQKILNSFLSDMETEVNNYIQATKHIKDQSVIAQQKMLESQKKWDKYFDAHKQVHSEFLRAQGVSNLDPLSEEVARLKNERDHIINNEKPRLDSLKSQYEDLKKERDQTIKKLYQEWDLLRNNRIEFAKEMTKRLKDKVKISISEKTDNTKYYTFLLDASPPGTQKSVVNDAINEFSPKEFVQLIRDKNSTKLCGGKITQNGAERLFQISEENLMELECLYREDIAQIELKLGEKYRALDALSDGERCTAILSIILLDEHKPLLIDQPEDELDHDFIMESIVKILSEVKQKSDLTNKKFVPRTGRQFIIATHNQNIPVLGDAELVIRMKKIPEFDKCEATSAFGMDHETTIEQVLSLEGGINAFKRRGKKYSSIVERWGVE